MNFPGPKCMLCSRKEYCKSSSETLREYPECRQPLLGVSIKRTIQLLDMMRRSNTQSPPMILQKMLTTWIARYNETYSEVFEPSLSFDSTGLHLFRFSYAFPGFKHEPVLITEEIKRLADGFASFPADAIHRLELAMNAPVIKQPIVGLAWDSSTAWRFKFYLQFVEQAGEDALKLAQAVVNDGRLKRIFHGGSLRLLGLDLGPKGMNGAKLYFQLPDYRTIPGSFLPVDKNHLLNWMASGDLGPPHDILSIHKLAYPGDPGVESPSELDFSLPDSELLLSDLRTNPDVDRLLSFGMVKKIFQEFQLAARRISVSLPGRDKMNLYYVLTEMDRS